MRSADTVFTVYLAPNQVRMQRLAHVVHGVTTDTVMIGYSSEALWSMAAVIRTTAHGTLKHELMHLMVQRDFPDVPAWLNEGLAALYEESTWVGPDLVGHPGWRGRVLRSSWPRQSSPEFPPLAELMGMSGSDFLSRIDDYGVSEALARYFVMYLQERGTLVSVYQWLREAPLFKERHQGDGFQALEVTGEETLRQIAERAGTNPAQLEQDFLVWLARVLPDNARC